MNYYEFIGKLALLIAGIFLGYVWGKFSTTKTIGFAAKITERSDEKIVTILTHVCAHEFSVPKGTPAWNARINDAFIIEYHIFRGARIVEFAGSRK